LPPLPTKIRVPLAQLGDEFLRYVESIPPLVQFFQETATLNHDVRFRASREIVLGVIAVKGWSDHDVRTPRYGVDLSCGDRVVLTAQSPTLLSRLT
jgi:hypothetical protein